MTISRVTFSTNILTIQDNLRRVQDSYNKAAIPATTGLRINTLSDDTSQISRMFSLRSLVADNEQYQKNIGNTKQFLGFTENRITQASDVLERIREIVIRGNDASLSTVQREQLANQIADLKDEFLGHANAKIDNRYVFAGSKFTTQPFTGTPTAFNGNNTITVNQLTATLQMRTNLDGEELFMGNVATAVGGDLAATLKDSDGVSLDLASGDTITVAGDIGGAFSSTFTLSATNTLSDIAASLQVKIRAAGAGTETVTVQGDGSLQVTAGATAITNLTMSVAGKTAFNTAFTFPTTINAAGTGDSDTLLSGTGEDIFDMIDDIQSAVASGDSTDMATHLDRLDNSLEQLVTGRVKIGNRLQQVDIIESQIGEDTLKFISDLSEIQDAKIDEVLTQLQMRETAMKVVFASSSQILSATANLQLNV